MFICLIFVILLPTEYSIFWFVLLLSFGTFWTILSHLRQAYIENANKIQISTSNKICISCRWPHGRVPRAYLKTFDQRKPMQKHFSSHCLQTQFKQFCWNWIWFGISPIKLNEVSFSPRIKCFLGKKVNKARRIQFKFWRNRPVWGTFE